MTWSHDMSGTADTKKLPTQLNIGDKEKAKTTQLLSQVSK